MNTDKKWLLEKAAKEDGCIVSVGGLVSEVRPPSYGNYIADTEIYPTSVTFDNGRTVSIVYEGSRPYLEVSSK